MELEVEGDSGDRADPGRAWFGTVIAVLGLLAAGWVAAAFIDEPPDTTCGSVIHPDTWRDLQSCTTPMIGRSLLTIGLVVGAAIVYLVSWRLWRPSAAVARYSALILLVASIAAVAHTEVVRSGGAFGPDPITVGDDSNGPPTTVGTIPVPPLNPG
jgi:hypothetical protein